MTLSELSSDLYLFLVTFRRQVRKGLTPEPRVVRQQLLDIFEDMDRKAREDAKLERLYEKAKYPLIVTADEILINSNWNYSSKWEDEILEYDFFHTRIAGEKFFTMIEDLGDEDEELAEVFYQSLCLGFVGRYKDDAEELRRLKRRLYRMVPGRVSDEEKRITPDAYFVAEGVKDYVKPLVNFGRIALVCAGLLIVLWIGYFFYVRSVSSDIARYAAEMRSAVAPGGRAKAKAAGDEDLLTGGEAKPAATSAAKTPKAEEKKKEPKKQESEGL